jgi:phosphoribosyl 1,2-cyclic phosphate phosphodiesterase
LRVQSHIAHLTIDEAVEMATKIGAKRTYFIHFSHDAGKHADVELRMPESMYLSYDNLQIEF